MINKIIPIQNEIFKENDAELHTFILDGRSRGAVLICPGGGYEFISDREGEPIAVQFNSAGYHAFVLKYNVKPENYRQPLFDVSKAMCLIRENAEKWNIDKDKIAICGFSAGGHAAASLGVYWDKQYLNKLSGFKAGMNKPDALILCYPVITSGKFAHRDSFYNLLGKEYSNDKLDEMSLEKHISKNTPPAFIWHTLQDRTVPMENSLLFAEGLRREDIPFELHIYPEGPHGLSLATFETSNERKQSDPHVATWMKLCTEWLQVVFK